MSPAQHIQAFRTAIDIITEYGNTIFTSSHSEKVKEIVRSSICKGNNAEQATMYNQFAYYFEIAAYYSGASRTNHNEYIKVFDKLIAEQLTIEQINDFIQFYIYTANNHRDQLELLKNIFLDGAILTFPIDNFIVPIIKPLSEIVATNYNQYKIWIKSITNTQKPKFSNSLIFNLKKLGISSNPSDFLLAPNSKGGAYVLNGVTVEAKEILLADEIYFSTGQKSYFPKSNLQSIEGFLDDGSAITMKELEKDLKILLLE